MAHDSLPSVTSSLPGVIAQTPPPPGHTMIKSASGSKWVSDQYVESCLYRCPQVSKVRVHDIPYSGKIWRGINFGGLANLSKGRQIKNSPIFISCACVSVPVHYVSA